LRGFDLSIIANHQLAAIENIAFNCAIGRQPRTIRAAAGMINLLASTIIEQRESLVKGGTDIGHQLQIIELRMPAVYAAAVKFVETVDRNGYHSADAIRHMVDDCAILSFGLCGESFNPDKDLVEIPPAKSIADKHPEVLDDLPAEAKLQVYRAAAKLGIIGREHYSWSIDTSGNCELVMTTRDGSSIDPVRFTFKVSSEVIRKWHHQALVPDHRPGWGGRQISKPRLPVGRPPKYTPLPASNPAMRNPAAAINGAHTPTHVWNVNSNIPCRQGVQEHRPQFGSNTLPNPVSGGPYSRSYSAGLGLWLSQVGFEQQELGEKPYGYAFNNPVTFVDPEGLFPCSPLAPVVPAPIPAPPSATGEASCYADNFKNCCTACGTCFNPCSNYAAILPGAKGIWGCGDQVKCCKTSNPAVCITVIIADTGIEDRLIDLPCCYAKKKGFMPSPGLVSVTFTRIGHVGVGGATSCPPKGDCAPPSNRGVNCGGLLDRNGNIVKKNKKTK